MQPDFGSSNPAQACNGLPDADGQDALLPSATDDRSTQSQSCYSLSTVCVKVYSLMLFAGLGREGAPTMLRSISRPKWKERRGGSSLFPFASHASQKRSRLPQQLHLSYSLILRESIHLHAAQLVAAFHCAHFTHHAFQTWWHRNCIADETCHTSQREGAYDTC